MAKKDENKVEDGVQGTPFTPDSQDPDFGGEDMVVTTDAGDESTGDIPEWAQAILDSNQAVLDSNQAVIDAVEQFKEGATEIVESIVDAANGKQATTSVANAAPEIPEIKVNRKAKYVVREGKKFADKMAGGVIRSAGYDVSNFDADRIKSLLQQGIVEEQK